MMSLNRSLCLLCVLLVAACGNIGDGPEAPPESELPHPGFDSLEPRQPVPKTSVPKVDPSRHQIGVTVIKLAEGSTARLVDGRLLMQTSLNTEDAELRRQNAGLGSLAVVQEGLTAINAMALEPGMVLVPAFDQDADELDEERRQAEMETGEVHASLPLYSVLIDERRDPVAMQEGLDALNELAVVEIAYPAPIVEPAAVDIPPTTDNLRPEQDYLDEIDASAAWSRGARGEGVRVVDVELGFTAGHEDLPQMVHASRNRGDRWSQYHGTAVLGVVGARDNLYGTVGIAHRSELGFAGAYRCFLAWCWFSASTGINRAARNLSRGDVLIIELHAKGPASGEACVTNCPQFEFIAMEYWPAEYDAIRQATSRGIIVVEAAGNGSMNLDAARYRRRFDRSYRDSGAILVGAGFPYSRVPKSWSNYGSRVDVQGWGSDVATLGYGDIQYGVNDPRQYYTRTFSGTSSATPIVAGSAAAIQSGLIGRGRSLLGSRQMRNLLRRTGTPQRGVRRIGPLPDLAGALDELDIHPAYDPCGDKVCGQRCTLCPPWSSDCLETQVLKYCTSEGSCTPDLQLHCPAQGN